MMLPIDIVPLNEKKVQVHLQPEYKRLSRR